MARRGVGLHFTLAGKTYEIVRPARQGEVGPANTALGVPDHWIVRDEDGNESRKSDWFIEHLCTGVRNP